MGIVIDTSVVIAVVTNEGHKGRLVELTESEELMAPSSLHCEMGNAFSAMFKRSRISLDQAETAIRLFLKIPIRLVDIDLEDAVRLSHELGIYAYDAYFIQCALNFRCPLLSLDGGLIEAARNAGVSVREV